MSSTRVSMSVWVYGYFKPDEFYWFSIDPSEDEVSEEELQKRRLIDDDENYDNDLLRHGHSPRPEKEKIPKIIEPTLVNSGMFKSACVALDRFIYAFGGIDPYKIPRHPESYIQCLDTTNVADLDGKIYIFGGGAKLGTPFAEVFDPLLKRVEKVEGPNDFWKLAGVDRVSKRFLFIPCISLDEKVTKTKTGPVIFYETKTNQWNHETHPKLGQEIDWLFDYSGCVVVATTIYWFSEVDVRVNAYDFVNNKFYYSTILSDLPDDWEDAFPFLFHMSEDYFCIVWVLRKKIHCTKFHISKCTTHKKLRVYVMDTDTYLIPGGDFQVQGALPTDDILAEMGLQKQHVNYGHLLALLTS
ncbi:hypothetical protein LguiA_030445 [Lonicera macranthoides]